MSSRNNGFTIVELIVTIIVIGILAGISYTGYTTVVARSNVKKMEDAVLSAANAVYQKKIDTGTMPNSVYSVDNLDYDYNYQYEYDATNSRYCLAAYDDTGAKMTYLSATSIRSVTVSDGKCS